MITGVHAIQFTADADALRAFLRDTLELPSVDAGGGWLIFGLPPAELAAHPGAEPGTQLYLMCDDIEATAEDLRGKGVELSRPVSDEGWGLVTAIALPGGGEIGLYEPRHERPPAP
jgi:predicted enzyme related to lactoylglutathione lyase